MAAVSAGGGGRGWAQDPTPRPDAVSQPSPADAPAAAGDRAGRRPPEARDSMPEAVVAIRAGKLVDVRAGRVLERQVVIVRGDRIAAVGAEAQVPIPAGAGVLDLSGATVLPGLIDSHTHITLEIENYLADVFRRSPIDYAVTAHIYARRTLEAGFTTVRDVGAGEFIDVAMKKAIEEGRFPGPRMFVAGHSLSTTGGHGDLSGFSPYLLFEQFDGIADGVDEIRRKVRWNIKYGADLIKFTATAGVLSEEESVGAPQYSPEEMRTIVQEARRWGRKVAAHAHGAEGIRLAAEAGVASVEHGSLLDDAAIAALKRNGTFLVPTVFAGEAVILYGSRWGLPQRLMDKARFINERKKKGFRGAIRAGVKIAYGTDAGVFPHGENWRDLPLLVELGLAPLQAIQSATRSAAELLGKSEELGVIRPGAFADLIAVPEDPTRNIRALERVPFVMKGGVVYKDELRAGSGTRR